MNDIKQYTDAIANAVYGEEVRGSIINALNKVNDDNNKYQEIKTEVVTSKDAVQDAVQQFDSKVANAKQVEMSLIQTTDSATALKADLDASVKTGAALQISLDGKIQKGTTVDTTLGATIKAAGLQDTNLKNSIQTGSTLKGQLDQSIQTAGTTNETLTGSITQGSQLNTNLRGSTTAAENMKSQLETATTNAGDEKASLEASIQSSVTERENIDKAVEAVNGAKSSLETVNQTAIDTTKTLDPLNQDAGKSITYLQEALPNTKVVLDGIDDIKSYIGYTDADIAGIQVDYAAKSFVRLAGAFGLSAGADFNIFPMFGGRKRCNVSDDGTITAWFGDPEYKEDGSNGQVMVYQPMFYYKVVPIVLERIVGGVGYHLRKANYYVSHTPKNGFRLHPAFYDEAGNQVDYILLSAYEGSVYDSSAAAYLLKDEQVSDFNTDLFCSIANAKPASGLSQNLNRPNIELMAKNRGKGWHSDTIKTTSANQLLMVIEMGMMNMQTAIAQGITQCSDISGQNCAAKTGSTTELGNATGMAAKSTFDIGGVITTETTNGKVSVTYRGMENPWGNLWKFVYGCNIHGDGGQGGGVPYICQDFNFEEYKITGNYVSAGFQLAPKSGYISAMGYSPACDWLFMPSECTGNSSVPVGDYTYITENLNGHRIVLLGGRWHSWGIAGAFYWYLSDGVGGRGRDVGGRLVYIPTGKAA